MPRRRKKWTTEDPLEDANWFKEVSDRMHNIPYETVNTAVDMIHAVLLRDGLRGMADGLLELAKTRDTDEPLKHDELCLRATLAVFAYGVKTFAENVEASSVEVPK